MKTKRIITIILAAAIAVSSSLALSGCDITGSSSEEAISSQAESSAPDTDTAEASSAEEKEESKEASSEEKKEEEKDKKDSSSKKETAIYKDMVGLIKEKNVLGYTVTKLVGSDDEHLIIAYGKKDTGKKDDTDTSNLIILDPEAYESELAEKEMERRDAIEATKLYSVYRITGNLAVPEGDLDGYYTTPYISANTSTPGLFFERGAEWKYGLIEVIEGSAIVNYSNEGTVKEEGDTVPPLPGEELVFSTPDNFDMLKKFRYEKDKDK